MENLIKVYVQLDAHKSIVAINSDIFINQNDLSNWIEIDEGQGDKYAHAQSNYLENGLCDEQGRPNYKLVKNNPVLLTQEEKHTLYPTPGVQPSELDLAQQKITELEIELIETNQLLTEQELANMETNQHLTDLELLVMGGGADNV